MGRSHSSIYILRLISYLIIVLVVFLISFNISIKVAKAESDSLHLIKDVQSFVSMGNQFIIVENGLVTMDVTEMSLRSVMEAITNKTELKILMIGKDDNKLISDVFYNLALEDAIDRLLRNHNHALIYDSNRDSKKRLTKVIVLLDKSDSDSVGGSITILNNIFENENYAVSLEDMIYVNRNSMLNNDIAQVSGNYLMSNADVVKLQDSSDLKQQDSNMTSMANSTEWIEDATMIGYQDDTGHAEFFSNFEWNSEESDVEVISPQKGGEKR